MCPLIARISGRIVGIIRYSDEDRDCDRRIHIGLIRYRQSVDQPTEGNVNTILKIRLSLIVVFVAFLGCAAKTEKGAKSEGGQSTYGAKQLSKCQSRFDEMKKVLKLNVTDEKALATAHQTQLATLEKWYQESGVELVALRKEALEAAKNRNIAKLKAMEAEGKKQRSADLAAEESALLKDYTRALLNAVGADDRERYQAHVIAEQLLEFFKPLELTDPQISETRKLAASVISRFGSSENWSGEATIELEKKVRATVLAAEQQKAFKEFSRSKGLERLEWSN